MSALKTARIALQVLVLALLGACAGGGGGGGGGSAVMPPPPPPPVSPPPPAPPLPPLPPAAAPSSHPAASSSEFTTNWGPGFIHADAAWQYQNAHGEGIIIGDDHAPFAGGDLLVGIKAEYAGASE